MDRTNELPELSEEPRDAKEEWGSTEADEITYRLGLRCDPVPGLPESLSVAGFDVEFRRGPVRAQHTKLRQRFGLPVVFDKAMARIEVGAGEMVALFSTSTAPVPDDLEAAFASWRSAALAAAGLVTSVLDERVAGEQLFEDALFFKAGKFVGAGDMRGGVRSFLPFEVNATDRRALGELAGVSAEESSAVARAARLYRRAALEGPTADAYAMLWVAAECFNDQRGPSRSHIEEALRTAGLNPDGLPITVGRLIGLRGEVQHQGVAADERLTMAFYEMEAVVRTLIRQSAGLSGGWWVAADNAAGFSEPFNAAVAGLHDRGESVWHTDGLPPVEDPVAMNLPRQSAMPQDDPRLEVDPNFGEQRFVLARIVLDAIEWIDPEFSLRLDLGRPPEADPKAMLGADSERIWIAHESFESMASGDPDGLVSMVWDLVAQVGFAFAQRQGIVSRGEEVAFVQAVGSWLQYLRLVRYGVFPAEELVIPTAEDYFSLGKLCGWAIAGEERAMAAVEGLDGDQGDLGRMVIEQLGGLRAAAPTEILASPVQSQ